MLPPCLVSLALLFLVPHVHAGGPPQPVPPKVAPTKLDNFTWADPFPRLAALDPAPAASCETTRSFAASEYQLHDLHEAEPLGLAPYGDALKHIFGGRDYPGGWHGVDAHGYERILLKMEYKHVPVKVRDWIAEQERSSNKKNKGLYAVYDKPKKAQRVMGTADLDEEQDQDRVWDAQRIVIFAPGAIYENLPLWVAEGSGCEGIYLLTASPRLPLTLISAQELTRPRLSSSHSLQPGQVQPQAGGWGRYRLAHEPHNPVERSRTAQHRLHHQSTGDGCPRHRQHRGQG